MIPKRVFWLTVGYGAGIGTSFYAARKVKTMAKRYTPDQLSDRISGRVGDTVHDLRAAVVEGRVAMREREQELHENLDGSRQRVR